MLSVTATYTTFREMHIILKDESTKLIPAFRISEEFNELINHHHYSLKGFFLGPINDTKSSRNMGWAFKDCQFVGIGHIYTFKPQFIKVVKDQTLIEQSEELEV